MTVELPAAVSRSVVLTLAAPDLTRFAMRTLSVRTPGANVAWAETSVRPRR